MIYHEGVWIAKRAYWNPCQLKSIFSIASDRLVAELSDNQKSVLKSYQKGKVQPNDTLSQVVILFEKLTKR